MNDTTYTPTTISEIVFANDAAREVIEDIASAALPFPFEGKSGILLYGTFGSGKTTLARLLPSALERGKTNEDLAIEADFFGCQHGHTNTAIVDKTKRILDITSLNASGLHYIIFDEVDNLSKQAQASLKTVLNCTRAIFILTTNNISDLNKGVKDRCILIDMNAAQDSQFLPLARKMTVDADVVLNDAQLLNAISGNNGSFRSVMFAIKRLILSAKRSQQAATLATHSIVQAAKK
jgi:replication-associated recombination protein RarA